MADDELKRIAAELKAGADALARELKQAADTIGDEVRYQFDKQMAQALADHPELFAEIRKTIRQVRRTLDKAAEEFGFNDPV